jgi:tryptophan-rich sensory protein
MSASPPLFLSVAQGNPLTLSCFFFFRLNLVSLFSVLIQESRCLVEGDLMMGDGWLIGFCVCIFGLSQMRKPSVALVCSLVFSSFSSVV